MTPREVCVRGLLLTLALGCTEAPPIDSGEPLPPKLVWTERSFEYETAPDSIPLAYPELGFEVWGTTTSDDRLITEYYLVVDGLLCERVSLQDAGYYCNTEQWLFIGVFQPITVYSYEE